MANYNKVMLMGNLTRDPVLRITPSQLAVVDFGLAINRRWRTPQGEDREETTFVDCTAWEKTAERINQYFQKGKPIFIEGRLKLDQWEDKQGGGKRSKLTVVVDNFQFIGAPQGGGNYQGGAPSDAPPAGGDAPPVSRPAPRRPAPNTPPAQSAPPPISDQEHFKDEDIPF